MRRSPSNNWLRHIKTRHKDFISTINDLKNSHNYAGLKKLVCIITPEKVVNEIFIIVKSNFALILVNDDSTLHYPFHNPPPTPPPPPPPPRGESSIRFAHPGSFVCKFWSRPITLLLTTFIYNMTKWEHPTLLSSLTLSKITAYYVIMLQVLDKIKQCRKQYS